MRLLASTGMHPTPDVRGRGVYASLRQRYDKYGDDIPKGGDGVYVPPSVGPTLRCDFARQ